MNIGIQSTMASRLLLSCPRGQERVTSRHVHDGRVQEELLEDLLVDGRQAELIVIAHLLQQGPQGRLGLSGMLLQPPFPTDQTVIVGGGQTEERNPRHQRRLGEAGKKVAGRQARQLGVEFEGLAKEGVGFGGI